MQFPVLVKSSWARSWTQFLRVDTHAHALRLLDVSPACLDADFALGGAEVLPEVVNHTWLVGDLLLEIGGGGTTSNSHTPPNHELTVSLRARWGGGYLGRTQVWTLLCPAKSQLMAFLLNSGFPVTGAPPKGQEGWRGVYLPRTTPLTLTGPHSQRVMFRLEPTELIFLRESDGAPLLCLSLEALERVSLVEDLEGGILLQHAGESMYHTISTYQCDSLLEAIEERAMVLGRSLKPYPSIRADQLPCVWTSAHEGGGGGVRFEATRIGTSWCSHGMSRSGDGGGGSGSGGNGSGGGGHGEDEINHCLSCLHSLMRRECITAELKEVIPYDTWVFLILFCVSDSCRASTSGSLLFM
mmetsp:Transcript_27723/g.37961  ORF Transcript_27723/g.37961 Transcript_27723/m.37961 type:complete len:355 (-) Transcript_27723:919-1983(-)